MPNRGIKESICTSESLSMLSAEAERLFYRLIVNCDDYGRMEAKTEIIRAKCFPLITDKIKVSDIEKWLTELANTEIILLYTNGTKKYLQFVTWDKHQRRRARESKYPAYDDEGNILLTDDSECPQMKTDDDKCPRTRIRTRIRDTNTVNSPKKNKFADFVSLTNDEHSSLVAKLGNNEQAVVRCIEILDNYKGSTGKTYKSDYRAILNWVIDRYKEEQAKIRQIHDPPKKVTFL